MKNLVIMGLPRCGKTTLAQMIADKYPCEIIHGDTLVSTIQHFLIRENLDEKAQHPHTTNLIYTVISDESQADLLLRTYDGIKSDFKGRKKIIIVDCYCTDISAIEKAFGEECKIYCFGVPNIDSDKFYEDIRLNDTIHDWTYRSGQFMLSGMCESIVNQSKTLEEEAKKHPNVTFVDTSENRREKIEEIFKELEKNII